MLIGSDASTDGTDEEIKSIPDSRLIFVRISGASGQEIDLEPVGALATGESFSLLTRTRTLPPHALKRWYATLLIRALVVYRNGMQCHGP